MGKTIPGGYYIGTDGRPHNAMGQPVPVIQDEPVEKEQPFHERVSIKKLPDALAEMNDVEEIEKLKAADPRSSAGAFYDARIAELQPQR